VLSGIGGFAEQNLGFFVFLLGNIKRSDSVQQEQAYRMIETEARCSQLQHFGNELLGLVVGFNLLIDQNLRAQSVDNERRVR